MFISIYHITGMTDYHSSGITPYCFTSITVYRRRVLQCCTGILIHQIILIHIISLHLVYTGNWEKGHYIGALKKC